VFPVLETERLVLRELTEYDAKVIFSILSNTKVTRYYGKETFKDIEEAKEFIHYFKQKFYEKRGLRWGIEIKETKQLIGTIGLDAWLPKQRRAEIGYEIHPEYWKKGYATESALKIISFGFNSLELIRIGAVVFPENESSLKLLQKIGFQKEGILRDYIYQDGISNDTYVYSIIIKDYKPSY
jgi:ribosomal-protein-alanine N-acetyltransferase